ncbi:hypothetical protein IAR55_006051 [Kwoniella newhampshirensis]|uniref:ditrans,polycis-polyprenyl diphosphate synthase [(2E,6E)-farnesyldiphosphate specific] n=1 Tax=Kwoniella newhampshirensis TaxID=1651941 RepID=A0AAW0YRW2_9TREE
MVRRLLSSIIRFLALPLFILLHLIFIISSLFLRTYQALTAPLPSGSFLLNEYDPSGPSRTQSPRKDTCQAPKHLGLVLAPSTRRSGQALALRGKGRREKDAIVESILRAVEWGGERGIAEISIWDGQGLIQSLLPRLLQDLAASSSTLPPSSPSSSPSTPSPRPTQDLPECDLPWTPSSPPRHKSEGTSGIGEGVTSVIVHPRKFHSKGLTLHFLPPSTSSSLITSLAKSYATAQISLEEMTVPKIDQDVQHHLNFNHDPELLVIHHLNPPSFLRSLLPRAAPELWGYPFWALRITEIYQYPTPPPILHNLTPVIQSLRASSLPFIRKLGYTISTPPNRSQGVLSKDEWDGAMRAWSNVEQRLGR